MSIVYDVGLLRLSESFCKDRESGFLNFRGGPLYPLPPPDTTAENLNYFLINHLIRIAELHLLHDGIALAIYGENHPLAWLLTLYGTDGLERLFDQDALKFVQWDTRIHHLPEGHSLDDRVKPLMPMWMGKVELFSDPEKSISEGLKIVKDLDSYSKQSLKRITKLASQAYVFPSRDVNSHAVDVIMDYYESGLLDGVGIERVDDVPLSEDHRWQLSDLANELMDLTVISSGGYCAVDDFVLPQLNLLLLAKLKDARAVENVTESIFQIENVPNFDWLIRTDVINHKDIPKLRARRGFRKFREWIEGVVETSDAQLVAKEYLDAITKKGFFDNPSGNLVKSLGLTAIGAGLGASSDAIFNGGTSAANAAVTGGAIGLLVDHGMNLGLNVLDSYVLKGLLDGWKPRYFFDRELRNLIARKEKIDNRN